MFVSVSGFRFDGIELGSAYRTWLAVVVESRVKKLYVNKCPQRFGLFLRHTGFCLITLTTTDRWPYGDLLNTSGILDFSGRASDHPSS